MKTPGLKIISLCITMPVSDAVFIAGVQTQPLDAPKGIQASETHTIAAGSHKSERGRLYQPSSKVHRHLLVCELTDRYRLLPCGRMHWLVNFANW